MINLQVGDIVVFKGHGFAFAVLSRLLKLFEPKWDRWGWHTGFISKCKGDLLWLCESLGGVRERLFDPSQENVRVYRWLKVSPPQYAVNAWVKNRLGAPYDVAIYFWTALQYLVRHFLNRRIPRLLDGSYSCWELVFEFAEDMGHPLGSRYDCPILTDLLKAVGVMFGRGGNQTLSILKERTLH